MAYCKIILNNVFLFCPRLHVEQQSSYTVLLVVNFRDDYNV